MSRQLDDPAWVELQKRIGEALAPFAAELGGRTCEHEEDWADCYEEDCGFAQSRPRPGAMPMIQHWLLLTATTDMAQEASQPPTMVAVDGPGQPGYVGRGIAGDYLGR